jgi:hypothetical protein
LRYCTGFSKKKDPTKLIGKRGKFKKEIIKLITLGRNK